MQTQSVIPIDKKVQQLKIAVSQCMKALDWLESEGFVAESIEVGKERRQPVIRIKHCLKCGHLKAVYDAYRYGIQQYFDTWRCDLFGIRVEWIERRALA